MEALAAWAGKWIEEEGGTPEQVSLGDAFAPAYQRRGALDELEFAEKIKQAYQRHHKRRVEWEYFQSRRTADEFGNVLKMLDEWDESGKSDSNIAQDEGAEGSATAAHEQEEIPF